jgi:eukaryotic-like serine/threonine-protein kinase
MNTGPHEKERLMKSERWLRIDTLFASALSREPGDRVAYLEAECGDDAGLRREVEELLAAHAMPGNILDEAAPIATAQIARALDLAGDEDPGRTAGPRLVAATHVRRCPVCLASFDPSHTVCPEHGEALVEDPEALLGTTLDGLYRIDRLLGTGGMGAVYLAHHALLRDRVAIKVLPRSVSADPEWVTRFLREGRAARAVQHPNLVRVHDLRTSSEGVLYMVQEFVEGETLREELGRRGRLSPAEALDVLASVASALDAAHAAGVVHRDVKPENVMVSAVDGERVTKVLDLGVTKLRAAAGEARLQATNPTQPGQRIGTPAYMAPEQWGEAQRDGGDEVDGRADVYSLGVMAYELVTGRQPFEGRTALEIWQAHVSSSPTAAHEVVPEIPEDFGREIARAMAKDRADRSQSAGQFARELGRALDGAGTTGSTAPAGRAGPAAPRTKRGALAAVCALLAIAAATALTARRSTETVAPETVLEVKSVAVLPFRYLGDTADAEYLGLGLTDALITRLGNIRRITVRPTGAVLSYSGATPDYTAIGRELDVDALLDGSVQRADGRVRVTVQLLRVSDGAPIWAATFDEAFTSIFVVQDSISSQMARALTLELSAEERRRLTEPDTENAEAYAAYLNGRFFWSKRTEEGLNRGIEHFERAIALDGDYALAHAGLAECYAIYNVYSASHMNDALPRAKTAAQRALALDDGLAAAHAALALVKEQYEYDWAGAEREFRRALEINPNYATAHQWYSEYLAFTGRTEESLAHIRRAHEIDPVSRIIATQLGFPFLCARRPDLAIPAFERAVALDPSFAPAHLFLGQAYVQKATYDRAIAHYKRAIELSGGSSALSGRLGYAYAVSGRRGEAARTLRDMERAGRAAPYDVASLYAGLGESERAMALLERAYTERDDRLVLLGVDGRFDGLRSDPRFADLLRRVGF